MTPEEKLEELERRAHRNIIDAYMPVGGGVLSVKWFGGAMWGYRFGQSHLSRQEALALLEKEGP